MATAPRPTKTSSGTTNYATGTTIRADEVNDDFNTIYTEVNGNIDNDNVVASAGILTTKIDDVTQATHQNPGITGTIANTPTTIDDNIRQVHYKLRENSLGTAVNHTDAGGTQLVNWFDYAARGENLVKHSSLVARIESNLPVYWSDFGSGSGTIAADTNFPGGQVYEIAASGADQGIEQDIRGLKPGGYYLVGVQCRATAGTIHFQTVGADDASNFRNVNLTTSSTTFTTLAALVRAQSPAVDITLRVFAEDGDTGHFANVFCYEAWRDETSPRTVYNRLNQNTAGSPSNITLTFDTHTAATNALSVRTTKHNESIWVSARCTIKNTSANIVTWQAELRQDSTVVDVTAGAIGAGNLTNRYRDVSFNWLFQTPTPGTNYAFQVFIRPLTTSLEVSIGEQVAGATARTRSTIATRIIS